MKKGGFKSREEFKKIMGASTLEFSRMSRKKSSERLRREGVF